MKIPLLFKKPLGWVLVGSVVAGGAFLAYQSAKPTIPTYSSTVVERVDLAQQVSETGEVTAELSLSYGFETSGKVADIFVAVGDAVTSGDKIASLAGKGERARLQQARASLQAAQARLALEQAGPSGERRELSLAAVAQAQSAVEESRAHLEKVKAAANQRVSSAERSVADADADLQRAEGGNQSQIVEDAYADLVNTLNDTVTKLTQTLTDTDQILGVDNTLANDEFDTVLGVLNQASVTAAEDSYRQAKKAKQDAQRVVSGVSAYSAHGDIDSAASDVQDAVTVMQNHLIDLERVLDYTRPIGDLSQSELSALWSDVSTAQARANTAASNMTSARQSVEDARTSLKKYEIAYNTAKIALANTQQEALADIAVAESQLQSREAALRQAQADHADLVAPPRNVDLASLRADVSQQVARVAELVSAVEETQLVALADGVVSTLDIEVGENVSANQDVVDLLSKQLHVEVDISESDIAKVSLNDPVEMTLDAFDESEVFRGHVVKIDPAETEISGVVYYKTTIVFDDADGRGVKPGMTANVDITTASADDVLVIPRRAVLKEGDREYVRVVVDATRGQFEERTVKTGLSGNAGMVEIQSGLEEGDEVVTFLEESE